MQKFFKNLLTILAILLLLIPFLTSGQLDLQNQLYQSPEQLPNVSTIMLETETTTPLAGKTLEITAKVYSTGETAGMVVFNWYKDGIYLIKESGQGKNKLKFTAGMAGSNNEIKLNAELSNGSVIERQIIIKPVDLDLDWQAETYSLPFSGVKPLASARSFVKVTALPIFKDKSKIQNVNYLWTLDGNTDVSQSGVGKQEFVFITGVNGRSHEIELIAKNPTETIKTVKTIFIKVTNPEILIYRVKEGNNLEIADDFVVKPNTILQFRAVPFSFSTKDFKNLSFNWQLAGNPIATNPEKPDIITIKTAEEVPPEGISANLSLEIKNKNNLFQSARKTATITIIK